MRMRFPIAAMAWLTCLPVAAVEPAADGDSLFTERVLPEDRTVNATSFTVVRTVNCV
jgi:hypothetical protein